MNEDKILVCGAGGFVGGAMVKYLLRRGFTNIRAVSSRPVDQWIYWNHSVDSWSRDLRDFEGCKEVVQGCKWIYNFAAKVGGIGYIEGHKLDCLLSSLINTNLLRAICRTKQCAGYFFASSACVYGSSTSDIEETTPLCPSSGYGEEKVFSERVCRAFSEEEGIPVKIARFTGIYGPGDTIKGIENKDHAPAALCRKVVRAKLDGINEIAIWGDGQQKRNFLYIDDCVEAAYRIMHAPPGTSENPINVGSPEVATVNELVSMLEESAGIRLARFYSPEAPVGVEARKYCLHRLLTATNWLPPTKLKAGLDALYNEIWSNVVCKH